MEYIEGSYMEKCLAIQKQVCEILGTDEVYLVGGSVRDLVMGNTPKDYDFCTSLTPDVMEERVKQAGRHVYGIGKKFGTIGFKVPYTKHLLYMRVDGEDSGSTDVEAFEYVEVTTFRSEVYTSKSRKPEVQFVPSLTEDLARRDFTMNAMILCADGSIFDPYGGRLDIYAKQIKTVGLPKDRIQEDPLRMLRAARFAARYDFKIDPNFIGKARQLADRIYDVSVERWVQELDKLLASEHLMSGMTALAAMGLLELILPELPGWHERGGFETADQGWKYLLSNVDVNPRTAKYMATGICHRLKFSKDRTNIILDKY